jgi:aldoxime dehydratase
MAWRPEYPREIAERRPPGHTPRAPRWTSEFDQPLTAITCDYLALQVPDLEHSQVGPFRELVALSLGDELAERPEASELLISNDRAGFIDLVVLGYWTDPVQHVRWIERSPLGRWFAALNPAEIDFGAWHEVIQASPDRVETIFSAPSRDFGFTVSPVVSLRPMTTNGYFGAARDRLPISAIDPLDAPHPHLRRSVPAPSRGARLRAHTGLNTTVIRSGQYWEPATGDQLEDYERNLEPKLQRGMSYLDDHREATGTMSLRILRNVEPDTLAPRHETSTLAYFHSLRDLEDWSETHKTHLAIYEHAIAKNREYGDDRTVTTWHEVFVMPDSFAYEYVNCDPSTGLLDFAHGLWRAIDD